MVPGSGGSPSAGPCANFRPLNAGRDRELSMEANNASAMKRGSARTESKNGSLSDKR